MKAKYGTELYRTGRAMTTDKQLAKCRECAPAWSSCKKAPYCDAESCAAYRVALDLLSANETGILAQQGIKGDQCRNRLAKSAKAAIK